MPYKFLLAAAAALTLAACSQAEAPSVSAPSVSTATKAAANKAVVTKTKAVLIYADWCGSCKILDPQIEKARAMGHIPGLEFVVLDYTTKDDANFYAQAETAGVGQAVRTYLDGTVKTGQLVLVDVDDNKVIKKIDKTFEAPQIITALKEAIAAS